MKANTPEQYVPKSAVVAEIENYMNSVGEDGEHCSLVVGKHKGQKMASKHFLSFINTLDVKEVELEENIKEEYLKRRCYGGKDNMLVILNEPQFNAVAKHFFELGLFSQLTWQDIRLISEIGEDFMNSEESNDLWKDEEVYYTAILNKLKEKGRDYKTERQITRELEQKGEEV